MAQGPSGHLEPPGEVRAGVADALGVAPGAFDIETRVGGGCIHPAVRLRRDDGDAAFLKWSDRPGAAGFEVEAGGLRALAERGGPAVPRVLGAADGGPDARGWLLLEWVEPGEATADTDVLLGRGLAYLHRPIGGGRGELRGGPPAPADVDDPWSPDRAADPHDPSPGWHRDGWIATLPQPNPPGLEWPAFWAEARLAPQWRAAREEGRIGPEAEPEMELLLGDITAAVAGWEADGISLLHGDLWGGNVLVGEGGRPHLVDPAVYRGHREVDLAMMDLFGGFGRATRAAYREAAPLAPGYEELRREVYQLYPLLVHVNLFGGGYAGRTLDALRRAVARVR